MLEIGKLIRRLQTPISEVEISNRVDLAKKVANSISEGKLRTAVSGVYLFGSTARKEARKSSDIDLAICLTHTPDLDFNRLGHLISEEIEIAKEKNGIGRSPKISITLIDEARFDPNWEDNFLDITAEIVRKIQTEGILLA